MSEAAFLLQLTDPHFFASYCIQTRYSPFLAAATISTFLASSLTYFMMDAAIDSSPINKHYLDETPEPHCRQP
jgi:hypothetical protein